MNIVLSFQYFSSFVIYPCLFPCLTLSVTYPSSESSSGNSGLSIFFTHISHRISKFIKIKFSDVVTKPASQQGYVSLQLEKKRNLEKLAHYLAQGHHFSHWAKKLKVTLEAIKLNQAAFFWTPFSRCPTFMVSVKLAGPFSHLLQVSQPRWLSKEVFFNCYSF